MKTGPRSETCNIDTAVPEIVKENESEVQAVVRCQFQAVRCVSFRQGGLNLQLVGGLYFTQVDLDFSYQ